MNRILTLTGAFAASLSFAGSAFALDKITFGTNWLAEAEHGGYYQAIADGTYAKYGLDVTIKQGGPQANNRILLPTGKVDFFLGGNMLADFNAVEQGIPTVVIGGIFQKDPQVLMSHPGVGKDQLEDLKNGPVLMGKEALATVFQWLKTEYGFKEETVKPYTFNPGPFIADKNSAQQGYVTSEPYAVEKQGGFKPNIFLFADYGWNTYATTIVTRQELVDKSPDLVQRFVDASIIGWYNYIYGDNKKANELIKKDNPDMDDAQIAFSLAKMKETGLIDSGDSLKLGIGTMDADRVKSFYDKMVKSGVVKGGLDWKKSFDLRFVNKKVGLDLRPKG